MNALLEELPPLAASSIPILISGETGTGKELFARTIHRSSSRSSKPFVAINCAAIPPDLLEPELFGIERGVATGVHGREGRFVEADGGTLFLDEIGEMPRPLQSKLLRVLQADEVQPVGGRPRTLDVRVVSATNAEMGELIETRRFRSDLYYRLAGAVLRVPPLRERSLDLPVLIEGLLRRFAIEAGRRHLGLSASALEALTAYPWPGNVRELENELRRAAHLVADDALIGDEDLSLGNPSGDRGHHIAQAAARSSSLELAPQIYELERRMIRSALERTRGNRSKAARLLGISRNTLADKVSRLNIDVG